VNERAYNTAAFDGALGFSEDGRHYRVRETNEIAQIAGAALYARWRPWADVLVETWLLPANPWHLRVHRIVTPRELHTTEGGFAVARADGNTDVCVEEGARAIIRTPSDTSVILDLSQSNVRTGRTLRALPNTNLIFSRSLVPQLRGTISSGTTVLAAAAMALPAGQAAEAALDRSPVAPDLSELEALFAQSGVDVSAILAPERF
jgi:hypothetical protein